MPLLFKASLYQERLLIVVEPLREKKHTNHSQWEVACFEMCLKTENELPSLLNAWLCEWEEYLPAAFVAYVVLATLEVCLLIVWIILLPVLLYVYN